MYCLYMCVCVADSYGMEDTAAHSSSAKPIPDHRLSSDPPQAVYQQQTFIKNVKLQHCRTQYSMNSDSKFVYLRRKVLNNLIKRISIYLLAYLPTYLFLTYTKHTDTNFTKSTIIE